MEVRKAAQALVVAWFNFLDKDPILLLRRLDTEGVPKTSKLCLDHLLPKLNEETLIAVISKWSDDYLDEKYVQYISLLELPMLIRPTAMRLFFDFQAHPQTG